MKLSVMFRFCSSRAILQSLKNSIFHKLVKFCSIVQKKGLYHDILITDNKAGDIIYFFLSLSLDAFISDRLNCPENELEIVLYGGHKFF